MDTHPDFAELLRRHEAGETVPADALLTAFSDFMARGAPVELTPALRNLITQADTIYRQRLAGASPPRVYSLALRMLGLGATTRSQTRGQARLPEPTPMEPEPAALSRQEDESPPLPNDAPHAIWRPWSESDAQPDTPRPATPADDADADTHTPRPATPATDSLPTIEILGTNQKYLEKFKTSFRQESMRLNGVAEDILTSERMESFFQTVIDRQIEAVNAQPHDRCMIELDSQEHTDRPVWLPVRRVDQLAPDVLLQQLVRTLNSNQDFLVDGVLNVRFTHIPTPLPGGKKDVRPCETVRAWLSRYNKTGVVYTPRNKDNMCLTRCVCVAQVADEKRNRNQLCNVKKPKSRVQRLGALQLCKAAGLDAERPCGLEEVAKLQDVCPLHRLVVVTDRRGKKIVFEGPASTAAAPRKNIYLFLHKAHFHLVLKPSTAFGVSYFCGDCLKGYSHKDEHYCAGSCWRCGASAAHTPVDTKSLIPCQSCKRYFANEECLKFHKEAAVFDHGKTTCQIRQFCTSCFQSYTLAARGKRKITNHICNSFYCKFCKDVVVEKEGERHLCYMQPWEENALEENSEYLRVYVDVETTQFHVFHDKQDWKEHRPNFVVCQVVCGTCEQEEGDDVVCAVHGARTHIFHALDDLEKSPVGDFLDFLQNLSSAEKKRHLLIWSHNGAGFDHHLFMSEMVARGMTPDPVCKGLRIIGMTYGTWQFKDSYLFLNTPLSKLPACFDLKGAAKGDFPYLFSHPDNYDYSGPLPDKKYYSVGRLSVKAAKEFESWYSDQQQQRVVFDFRAEIEKYTVNDVRILRLALEKFRKDFIEEGGFDCLQHCLTLSSTTLSIFRRNFMAESSMGIVPRKGFYRGLDTQSLKAMQWLRYENSLLEGAEIRHAGNGREVRLLGKFKVDGYAEVAGKKLVYDFLGCYFHAHPGDVCLNYKHGEDAKGNRVEKDRKERYYRTLRVHDHLRRAGYTVKIKWECHFDNEVKCNPAMATFFERHPFKPPPVLDERAALYGGRTSAFKSYYKCEPGEKINYFDFQSLYPGVLCFKEYPLGHPDVYVGDEAKALPLDNLEGLISCTVLPPQDLLMPLLPYRAPSGRLIFVLCRSCGESLRHEECNHHRAEERWLKAVWPIPEVREALKLGYKILDVEEIWNYTQRTQYDVKTGEGGLFSSFIRHWVRKKIECSGWPADCKTDADKEAFVKGNKEHVGITIDPKKVKKNASRRHIFKLIVNSGWGKLCEISNRNSVSIVKSHEALVRLVTDDTLEVQSITPLSDDAVQVNWKKVEDCQESLPTNSLIHGIYTTMYGRLELYKVLASLGDRVCYADTDSCVYVARPGLPDPPLGKYLMQLSDEMEAFGPGSYCYEFVSAGAKAYGMKIACGGDVDNTQIILKLKGVTLNQSTSKVVTFERFKEMVLHGAPPTTIKTPGQIARVKGWKIVTRPAAKIWRPNLNKRRLLSNQKDTLPFGFVSTPELDEEDLETLEILTQLAEEAA